MTQNPAPDPEFASLLDRARAGSQTALSELVKRFTPTVYRAIRRAMAKSTRHAVDSDDIAQSVWQSFFAEEKYLQIQSPALLHGYLKRMATFKTIDCGRRFLTQRRRSQGTVNQLSGSDLNSVAEECPSSPSKELMAQESLQKLIESVPSRFSEVIRKRAQGATISEISAELKIPLRSLHRILRNARARSGQ